MLYSEYGGDIERFLDDVYGRFRQDFVNDCDRGLLEFEGVRVNLRRHPMVRGREASFWHLTSTGNIEDERTVDLRRCECVVWARAVLNNATDPAVKKWENVRDGNTNICLWLVEENYLVVLGRRNGYVLLLTAYLVEEYRRKRLEREYAEYISATKS